jgi:HEAT repeat protein
MHRSCRRVLALFLVLAVALPAVLAAREPAGDETLQNFKTYYAKFKDTASRVEAILTLEGHEDAEIVEVLLPKLKEPDSEIVRAVVRVFAGFKSKPPLEAMLAALKSDKTEAVRTGILRAFAEGKFGDVGPAVQACLADKSWDVRRRALQAILAAGKPESAAVIAPLCADPEPAVRCTALDGLTSLGSDKVVAPAIASLGDPMWQVRKSAIAALTKVRSAESIDPMIRALEKEEGVLVPEIAEGLACLTGQDLGSDAEKWKAWWAGAKANFALPSAEAIAYLRTRHEARTGGPPREYQKSGTVEYHGIDTPSRSILFIIDVSGSMESVVTEKERFESGHYPSFKRIDIVKTELQRTLDHLEPFVHFNILAFATDVDFWKKQLVPANVLNKAAAKDWAGGLLAIGGNSKEDLAAVGLMGSANLDKGKTNTYGALMAGLSVKPGVRTGEKSYAVEVDTIFFLSDGRPTVGDFVDPDDILREVLAANELRKVKIHTIAIGEFQKDFMRKIAEKTGGVFVDLGK